MYSDELSQIESRAWALLQVDRERDAIPLFQRALQLDPENASLLCGMAGAFYHLEEWKAALEYADRAIATEPENDRGHLWRSYCLKKRGDRKGALAAAAKAAELDPWDMQNLI